MASAKGPLAMSEARPRYKRSLKNYLIDSRFQLKYTGFILVLTSLVAAPLGGFLFRTSGDLVRQSERVAEESKKVSEVVRDQIKNDYGDNPELIKTFSGSAIQSDSEVLAQQQGVIASQQKLRVSVIGGLGLLVLLITLLGIYFTHKVAGPIYKMKMLLRQVGEGKLNFRGGLRKGDELQDFFETFAIMVESIKARQKGELDKLEHAIAGLRAGGQSLDLKALETLRDEMSKALES